MAALITATRLGRRALRRWAKRVGKARRRAEKRRRNAAAPVTRPRRGTTKTLSEPRVVIDRCECDHGDVVAVAGWAMCPGARVVRVDILAQGHSLGRARLGLPRPDLARRYSNAEAPVCGFSVELDAGGLLGERGTLRVDATAYGDGAEPLAVGEAEITFGGAEPRWHDPSGRVEQLRERTRRLAREMPRPRGPMRVLAFSHDLELGGAQLYLVELLERLAHEEGWSCTVLSPSDGPLRQRLESLGMVVHISGGHGLEGVEAYEGRMAELVAWAVAQEVDLVIANTLAGFVGVDLAGRVGAPSIFAVHESMDFPRWTPSVHTWMRPHRYVRERIEAALESASAVVFEASATRAQYTHLGDSRRLIALPYAIELARVDAFCEEIDPRTARQRLGLPEQATVITCLGTFEPRKAQGPLVQAFAALAEDRPDLHLCLVGERSDAYSRGVRSFIERSGLESRCRLSPMVRDPYLWHRASDLIVLPSDRESLPRVVLEAMAFETPVLATAIFGLPSLLRDGEAGELCEPRDIGALVQALDRVLGSDQQTRDERVHKAARVVREDHDPVIYGDAIKALATSLMRESEPPPAAVRASLA